jgi:ABC-2 type transport system ATP-binding protein
MLEVRNLSKSYSGIPAVQNVSFVAKAGEVTGYLGPNGSGKSTTMKMLTGLIGAGAGEILLDGRRIADDLIWFRHRLGYVPEEPYLYTHLSGLEHLTMAAQLHGLPKLTARERIDCLLQSFGLSKDGEALISSYSKGMRQKILLAAALLHNPDLIILDEPFSGLDIGSALLLRSLIEELGRRGKVVLFSSHELETVERLCSHVVILHRGQVVADDSVQSLRALMSLPSLESIFAQLAVEQDSSVISRNLLDLIYA